MNQIAVCGLIYLVCLFLSYLSHSLLDLNETCATYSTSTSIAISDLSNYLRNITPEHTAHSRVNDSKTYNANVICLQFFGKTNLLMYNVLL